MRCAWLILLGACDGVLGFNAHPLPDATDAPPPIDAPICGKLGEACCAGASCTDGSSCVAGTTGARCLAFAGAYEKVATTTCGAPACLANPQTGACACPAAFPSSQSVVDEGCGDPAVPQHQTAQLSLCGISSMPPNSEWGGAYVIADIPECEPATSPPGCLMTNPITADCTCPAGAEIVTLRVFVPGTATASTSCPGTVGMTDYLGGVVRVCLMPVAQPVSLYGVYQLDHDGSCRTHSSALAGCACPTGTVASSLTSIDELGAGFPQTQITFCVALP
ncbi:MAG: hypothetical protein ACM31C_23270 [Acidobacteriota bacterium]